MGRPRHQGDGAGRYSCVARTLRRATLEDCPDERQARPHIRVDDEGHRALRDGSVGCARDVERGEAVREEGVVSGRDAAVRALVGPVGQRGELDVDGVADAAREAGLLPSLSLALQA